MSESNYALLIQKLDAFIRRYYLNQMVRGGLYTLAIVLSAYLLFSILEYYFYFPPALRKVLFYGWLLMAIAGLFMWVIQPLLRFLRLGKIIDYSTAGRIIGDHFANVEDKLLNILQLRSQSATAQDKSLIEASINQKIAAIQLVPFREAIDIRKNKKYLPFAIPPVAVLLFLLFAAPNVLVDSNYRLIRNNRYFEKEAPFRFRINNTALEVPQYENFELSVDVGGNVIPAAVSIITPTGTYPMEATGPGAFTYTFRKIPADVRFRLEANGFSSASYTLSVIPLPSLQQFSIRANYPDYTGKKDEVFTNTGDLTVPEGTTITWEFSTAHTNSVEIFLPDSNIMAGRSGKDQFEAAYRFRTGGRYAISVANEQLKGADTLAYFMQVLPDAYPQISVQQASDSTDEKYLFFMGEASDDYGFTRGGFYYKVERSGESGASTVVDAGNEKITLDNKGTQAGFVHAWDMGQLALQPGDRVNYYFEVWDNDGVNGPKSARSAMMQYRIPGKEELKEMRDAANASVQSGLEKVLEELRDIRKETAAMEEKLLQQKDLNWEDKKILENLMERQQQLQEKVGELKKELQANQQMEQEYLQPEEKIMEKQRQLEELFNEVMDEEMKELYKELQELMEQLNKEQSLEQMEEMDINNEQLEQELDRMLELFKQLQLEEKMQEAINALEELAKEQEQVSEETKDKASDMMDNIDKQDDINQKFEDIKKDLEEIGDLNESLEQPKEMGEMEQQQQEIGEKLDESKKQLMDNKRKQASEEQKSAAEKMQQMAEQMQQQMSQQQQEQQQEDMESLQRLLDNLLRLSIDQEDLMYAFRNTGNNQPRYVELMEEQQRIKEDTRMVEDSLIALSKRVMQISTFITREMAAVNKNLEGSLEALHERTTDRANVYQQYAMTSYNNLALMLDEVMQQMQQQMAQSMPGSQMCQKPGGESQLPSMSEMQKQLNEQLQKMKGQMNEGPKPGERNGMSQQLAETARKQAALREALQKMAEELGGGNTEDGKLAKQLQEIAEQMDKTEEDIVNKRLTEATLRRQQDILTRLLEATDAERERKQDKERQSNTAQETPREMPPALEEYLRKRQAELDLYKTVAPELKPFYQNLVEEYFRSISFQ